MLLTCKDFDAFKQRQLYVRTAILVLSKHNQYIRLVLGYREVYSATWKHIRGRLAPGEDDKNGGFIVQASTMYKRFSF